MDRFSINNRFRKVSLDQFKQTAESLESTLKNIRPEITTELLITTNELDYNGYGSLTFDTPETKEALERRERYSLNDLSEELWNKSFETGLYLKDDSITQPYRVSLTTGSREPKKIFFYAQCLDEKSQKAFDSFKRDTDDKIIENKDSSIYKIQGSDFIISYISLSAYSPKISDNLKGTSTLILSLIDYDNYSRPDTMNLKDLEKLIKEVNPNIAVITNFGISVFKKDMIDVARTLHKATGVEVISAKDGLSLTPSTYIKKSKQTNLSGF